MFEKKNNERIKGIFFGNPTRVYSLREIARKLKISPSNVHLIIQGLAKEGLIYRKKKGNLSELQAKREEIFVWQKKVYNLSQIYSSGLKTFLEEAYAHPETIVLFGSYSRGEDTETSDIDLAVVTAKKLSLNLAFYEKKLKRKISIHEITLEKVRGEFLNNLANGLVIAGYLKIR